jgi:NADH-quinone oxidoreductase subunit G
MSNTVKLTINEKEVIAKEGDLLIDKVFEQDINLQHFCYHPALGVDGNCRMCMVEIEGSKRPQIACDTFVKEGMVVRTVGENIEQVRKDILELELINHPIDCPVCDQAGECKLQDFYMESGFYDSRMDVPKNNASKCTDLGKNVMLDQERCVMCTRCVRFTRDITKSNELGVEHRTDHSVITTFPGMKLQNDYSMNVVDICPVGALTNKDFRFNQRVWFLESFDGICQGCSKGCNVHVDHAKEKYKDDKIFRLRPKTNLAVNGYFMCDYGRMLYKNENENRVLKPTYQNNEMNESEALNLINELIETNENVMILCSPKQTLEELKALQEFAKNNNMSISGYSQQYIDDNFADDMLKTNDKAPNRKAFEELGIDESVEYFKNSLDSANVILVFQNDFVDTQYGYDKNKKIVLFTPNKVECGCDVIFYPIASAYEKTGTFINIDGVKQKQVSKMKKDNPIDDITSVIRKLTRMAKKD